MLARWRCRRAVLFCGDEDWNRTQIVDAAWTGATPAAFYLGLCRLRGILSPPALHDFAVGGLFFAAATKVLQRFPISSSDLAIAAAKRSNLGQSVHRFSISGPDLRIDAAKRSKQGQTVHRFLISSPNLRIDAAKRSKQGQSVHRFLISGPDLRIDAVKRSKQGQTVHRFSISSPDLAIAATMHPCPAPENSQRFRI